MKKNRLHSKLPGILTKNKILVFLLLFLLIFVFVELTIIAQRLSYQHNLQLLADCGSSKNDSTARSLCVEHWFHAHGDLKDPDLSLKIVDSLYKTDKISGKQCHAYEHMVAMLAYESNGNDTSSMLDACDNNSICGGGCYHGGLMEAVHMTGLSNSSLQQFIQLCLQRKNPEAVDNCFHGLGHGFVHASSNDLLGSLSYCDMVAQKSSSRDACHAGVFMQAAYPDFVTGEDPPYYSRSDALYPCSEVPQKYQFTCYRFTGERTIAANKSFGDAALACAKIQKEDWQKACRLETYKAIVRREGSAKDMQEECLSFDQNKDECFKLVASFLQGNPKTQGEKTLFCSGLKTEQEKACREGLQQ